MKSNYLLCALLLGAVAAAPMLYAGERVPTRVRVRAVSRDAKVIGTGVGGALITIAERSSGEILARGIQLGGTGDTEKIMKAPRQRGGTVYATEGSAYFETTLMLDRPTEVEVAAEGPLAFPQALQRSSKTLLLIPGKDIVGEGILLEINSFIVRILEPAGGTLPEGREVELRVELKLA